jgi:hypothetical protein
MGGVGVVDEAPPRRSALLGLAHQHQSGPAGRRRLVLVGTGDLLFGLAHLEADHRNPGALLEGLEVVDQALVVAVEQDRRGNGAAGSIEQELHHPALVLEPGDVAPDPDAVHRSAAKADVLVQ